MAESQLLKKDLFGEIRMRQPANSAEMTAIVRNSAAASPWVRFLARWMMRREAAVLARLEGLAGTPELLSLTRDELHREYLPGYPMQQARPDDPAYFRHALRLLRQLHARQVAHNDLAKEPNILVTADGSPAFIDYQLAFSAPRRGRLFRLAAREDLRHLLKHKRQYCPQHLTTRQRQILETPSLPSRLYAATFKPVYLFVTRRLLGWQDREGAGNRGDTA